ncbi:hypothetical protein HBH42_138110 [Parastagonospora nodorum]|nr:hypothetical protein HBH42_138110 [Parastagonospora nodorum]
MELGKSTRSISVPYKSTTRTLSLPDQQFFNLQSPYARRAFCRESCLNYHLDCENYNFTGLLFMLARKTKPRSKSGRSDREQGLATPPPTSPVFAAYSEEELQAAETLLKILYGSPIARTLAQEARDANIDHNSSSTGLSTHPELPQDSCGHLTSSSPPLVRGRSSSPTSVDHVSSRPKSPSPANSLKPALEPIRETFSTSLGSLEPSRRASKPAIAPDLELLYTPLDQLRDSRSSPYTHEVRSVAQLRRDPFPQGIFPSHAVITGTDSNARQAFIDADSSDLSGGNIIAAVQRVGHRFTLNRGIFPSQEVMFNIWPGVRRDFQEAQSKSSGGHVFAALRERGTIFEHNEKKADVAALRRRIERESSNNAWYRARRRDTRDESEDEELDWGSDDETDE